MAIQVGEFRAPLLVPVGGRLVVVGSVSVPVFVESSKSGSIVPTEVRR